MPLSLRLRGPRGTTTETRTLDAGSLSVGRGAGNDWVLPDPDRVLSKTHCTIAREAGRTVLVDSSTNGMFINGSTEPTRRDSRTVLSDGDSIRLGEYVIEVSEDDSLLAPPRPRGAGAGPPPPALAPDPLDDPFAEPGFAAPRAPGVPRLPDPFDRADEMRHAVPDPLDDLFRSKTQSEQWSGPSQPDNIDAPRQAYVPPRAKPAPPPASEIDFDALLGDDPIDAPPTAAPPPEPTPFDEPPRAPLVAPPPQPLPRVAADADTAALLTAFLRGAGMTQLAMPSQDPAALFEGLGALLRVMVEGLREVLISRAAVKSEMRVEQTMLRARDNNALKFAVTVEDALAALILPDRPGYLPKLAAAKEAFDDVRGHELAVMAGVQTALLALLRRFDPAALEKRLQPAMFDAILPAARKARFWELFCATYKDIARESEDDFRALFGREFARAYDAQIRKL